MNPYASPQAYRESSVLTASPGQLVVMLYDGAARFLRQAEIATDERAWSHAVDRIARAEAIVDELMITLDHEQGGEIAQNLQGIYVFCKKLLIEARIQRSSEPLRQTAKLLGELRVAFSEAVAA